MRKRNSVDISVVVPVYGCRAALPELYRRLVETLEGMEKTFEIILVNDACPQGSWCSIEQICSQDNRVIGVDLARNFGQIRAITAGLDASCGEWVVVMDCDLQDRPESIPQLYKKTQEGFDVVFARRVERKDSFITKLLSKTFYKVYEYFTNGNYDSSICNFSISRRVVIDNYCRMREHNRAYTMFIKWLGFKQTAIDLVGDERFEGESSYSFGKKTKMAAELITAQSTKPLRFAINIGFLIALFAFIYLLAVVVHYFVSGSGVPGYTSTIASIYLMGGMTLMAIGIVGIYVGSIFNEVKGRPLYVVSEVLNGDTSKNEKGNQ